MTLSPEICWDTDPQSAASSRTALTGRLGQFYVDIEFNPSHNGWVCIFDDLPLPCVLSERATAARWFSQAAAHILKDYPGWGAWVSGGQGGPGAPLRMAHESEHFLSWADGLHSRLIAAGLARATKQRRGPC